MKFLDPMILAAAGLALFSSCTGFQHSPQEVIPAEGPPPSVIPRPDTLVWERDMYLVSEKNLICHNEEAGTTAEWLKELLKRSGIETEQVTGENCGNWNLQLDPSLSDQLGEEGYVLDISEKGVAMKSATQAGLFYAVQSLRQFFPAWIEQPNSEKGKILLRKAHVVDRPEFSWRGTMVDVARSFFGIEYLKRHVDRMALYKMNRLHLHLTDDQGWRIEIKGRPKLTEIGSKGSVKNGNSGFLTQEEYRELQEYALARNIVIIPEIDMPGHIYSALVSYPELNCPQYSNLTPARVTPPQLYSQYRVGWSKLCLENPKIYDFVSEVIGEIAGITKGPWIHIGGDEIEDPRYKEFVIKADSIVQEYGKTSIGWEEVTQAKVSSSLISQKWRGTTKSVVDTRVIQSLCSHFYFDHANFPGQKITNNWCKENGVSLKDVYSFRNDDERVIGVEAPVWTEFIINEQRLDDRFWPRSIAVAEIGWTAQKERSFEDFSQRLGDHGARLHAMGVGFHPSPEIEWDATEAVEGTGGLFSDFMP